MDEWPIRSFLCDSPLPFDCDAGGRGETLRQLFIEMLQFYGTNILSSVYYTLSCGISVLELGDTPAFGVESSLAFHLVGGSILCDDGVCLPETV